MGCSSKATAPPEHDAATAVAAKPADAAPATPRDAGTPPGRVEHAVFSLVDNRHAAHRYVNGDIVLDASDVGFARYTRFGVPAPRWHIGYPVDGVRAAIADPLASLEVPMDLEMAKSAKALVVRVHAATDKQALSIKLNGRKATKKPVPLKSGWQTIAFVLDKGLLGIGENQIAIETLGSKRPRKKKPVDPKVDDRLAFEWLLFTARDAAKATDDPRGAVRFDAKTDAIELAKDATVLWYVTVPDGAHLVADVGGTCKVEVRARASDDSFAGGLLQADSPRVDLTAMAGKVVGLTLTARECDTTSIRHAEIRLHGPAVSPLPRSEPPKYIVLWVMDATRADKIPVFTPGARAQTPNLEELAKSSAVFRQYYVQGNESQTSHSSVWTGLYPAVHNVRLAGQGGSWRIDVKYDVIAQKLADAGFYTIAVTGNGFVNQDGGYARGFKEFRNLMRESGQQNGIIYGQKIVDAALGRLDAHKDARTYLVLGTIDNHGPWIARKPWIDIYSPPPYNGPFKDFGTAKELGITPGDMGCSIIPPPADVERLRAIYDSALSYQDQQIGRFIAKLKSWGIWDQTMLIITADHGEELFEDRRCGHGGSLRDSLIRVPLLVHDPARFPAGTIVDEGVEGVDVFPTLLDALGLPSIPAIQGVSLTTVAQGIGKGWARPSYASMFEYAHAMRIGRWKIRVGAAGLPIVDDLGADPGETQDLAPTRPVERRMLTDNLGMFLALRVQWNKAAWGVTTNMTKQGAAALDQAQTP
ncbi:MAG TPA: sulfatase [Kofleriaceae bacterium]|nr:sulfatase [Kofleriaceae bacterium]